MSYTLKTEISVSLKFESILVLAFKMLNEFNKI